MANPLLVLGGVAVGVITAGVGVLQVPGWIASAQDSSAKNDIAQITIAEAAANSVKGSYFNSIAALNSSGSGVTVSQSDGVKVGISINATNYIVVTQSASGKFFARVNGGKIGEGTTAAAAVTAAGGAPGGLAVPTPA